MMVTEYECICFICGNAASEIHHLVFGRGMRKLADEDGLTAPCCNRCHKAIHEELRMGKMSKICGQLLYEKTHTREEFRKRYGRSYL